VRHFDEAFGRYGSFSTEATAPGKRVDVGSSPKSRREIKGTNFRREVP
jgi:hypothetical protein